MAGLKGTAEEIKDELLWVAQESLRTNLVHGTAGNFSARLPDGNVVLTPSSLAYETMTLDDLVVCDLDGNVRRGQRASPTTEKMLHLACLKAYDDIHAVIHCHAKFCTMFALTHQPIPCAIEEVEAFVGGDVPVANYQFTGSQDLADEVSKWVGDRAAVLMANHGLLTVGKSPEGRAEDREPGRAHRRDHVGRAGSSARSCRSPTRPAQKMAPVYKMLRGHVASGRRGSDDPALAYADSGSSLISRTHSRHRCFSRRSIKLSDCPQSAHSGSTLRNVSPPSSAVTSRRSPSRMPSVRRSSTGTTTLPS